ncbi:aspartyl protease APCB1-like [Tripterygium wilfordii]|uniref:aspartyl protease APCB1-like n=1 Tax=Tripterygium wilfordii TaxID=458696 RepID=UPI0018F827E8|nr:aspartyl protease APCB1-like [Tripterygium wilfordii]
MEGKRLIIVLPSMMMIVVLLCTIFEGSLATSSIVFSLSGNAYPKGAYFVDIHIGDQAEPFELHVDTGSSLTWVKCVEPFENYAQPQEGLYKPPKHSIVQCQDPLCAVVQGKKYNCENTTNRCDYIFEYDDGSLAHGYLVNDHFHLRLFNGSIIRSLLVFGCGYKQTGAFDGAGIFGLSRGPLGFSSQIHSQGLTQQVTSHCLSSRGGGFLFIGDDLVPPSGISWTPITSTSNHGQDYGSGPVELLFNGSSTQVRGLQFIFDSGSDLSYLNHPPYQDTLDWISDALKRTPLIRTQPMGIFPICWKHNKSPIRSFDDVKNYFKSLTLNFTNVPNVKLNLPVHAYLIRVGVNVCLAILDCGQVDVENPNVIGVFSMQDKLMIYDNVNHRIGWASSNCNMPAWR